MAEVQNIGPMDYTAAVNGANPQDYATAPADDLSNMPVVYDEATEQKKKAALGMTGATILGLAMLAIGGFVGHKMGAKSAEEIKVKAEEAIKNYEKMQEATTKIEEAIAENNSKGFWGRFSGFQEMKDKISELIKPFKKEAAKVEETAEKAVESAAEKAEGAAEKAAEEAKNAADGAAAA